jgi:hypothetical protein
MERDPTSIILVSIKSNFGLDKKRISREWYTLIVNCGGISLALHLRILSDSVRTTLSLGILMINIECLNLFA